MTCLPSDWFYSGEMDLMLLERSNTGYVGEDVLVFTHESLNVRLLFLGQILVDLDVFDGLFLK